VITLGAILNEQRISLVHFGLLYEKRRIARERYASLETFSTLDDVAYLRTSHELAAEIAQLEKEIDTVNRHIDNLEIAQWQHPNSVWRRLEVIEEARLAR
jgi:hypothetical protein